MAGLTSSGRNDLYNGTAGGFRGQTRHLALFVGDPDSGGTEVSATGYSRLQRTATQMPVSGTSVQIAVGEWDDSADASWGTPTYLALYTSATGGTRKWSVLISPALGEITTGSRVFTNAGDITFEITG